MLVHFDRETIALLRTTLDRAWDSLPAGRQAVTSRLILAERILKAAAEGERDPDRLRARAIGLPLRIDRLPRSTRTCARFWMVKPQRGA
jgi:hypothetical protein